MKFVASTLVLILLFGFDISQSQAQLLKHHTSYRQVDAGGVHHDTVQIHIFDKLIFISNFIVKRIPDTVSVHAFLAIISPDSLHGHDSNPHFLKKIEIYHTYLESYFRDDVEHTDPKLQVTVAFSYTLSKHIMVIQSNTFVRYYFLVVQPKIRQI